MHRILQAYNESNIALNCPRRSSLVTTSDLGRLGNQIAAVATLIVVAEKYKMKPILSPVSILTITYLLVQASRFAPSF